jgi:hypothetical protein
MDESGFNLNNETGKVLATKRAQDVHSVTSCERGENVSLIACCSAEGNCIPPVLFLEGERKKKEFIDALPRGSKVYKNKKSSYIISALYFR